MGFWGKVRETIGGWFGGSESSGTNEPVDSPVDSPDWGREFGSDELAYTLSNDGYEFGWSIAGYKAIGSEREDLEKEPSRVLTDAELQTADYLVVYFTGGVGYKTFTGGPWEDWEELWSEIADFYDIYEG